MTMTLAEGAVIVPPRSLILPAGDYAITSQYPDFISRTDTLLVFQGRSVKRRVLLLPENY